MKRIIACVTNDLNYDRRMIRICSTLSEAGYDVTLAGRERPDSQPLAQRPFEQVRLACRNVRGPQFYAEYNMRLRRYLQQTTFDLAIACDLDTLLATWIVASRKGKPYIYDAHEYFIEVPELVGRPFVRSIWHGIGKRGIPGAAAAITVAPMLALELEQKYGRPFRVVRNVPDLEPGSVKSMDERSRTLLYQGALNEGRGLEVAIDAMAEIDELDLLIIGEGDLSNELRRYAVNQRVETKVRFAGRVPPADLPGYTADALVGLNLLENKGLNYYYSLANKFFDYIQNGTPSINMAFPEYENVISDHAVGVCIEELSVNNLVEAIGKITDRKAWQLHANACTAARKVYNWQSEQRELLNIIEDVVV